MDDREGLEDIDDRSAPVLWTGVVCCSLAIANSCSCLLLALSLFALYPLPWMFVFAACMNIGAECECCGVGRCVDGVLTDGCGRGVVRY
jgi:hypothetical protein